MMAEDPELVRLIRESLPPMSEPPATIDLWSRLQRRISDQRAGLGRLDWLMAALATALLVGFPETVTLVLYHL